MSRKNHPQAGGQKKAALYNKKALSGSIMAEFNNNPARSYNYKQVAKKFEITDESTKRLITTVLYELTESGHLEEIYTGKFKLKAKSGYITGLVDMTSKGYAFIVSDEMPEHVFVSQKNLHTALHGDKVKVYLYAKRKQFNLEGEVIQVLERNKTSFVGTVDIFKHYAFFISDSPHMPYDIYIPIESLKGAKSGQKVLVRIVEWSEKTKNPLGEVIEVLGDSGSNEAEMHAILVEFGLPYKFPDNLNRIAETISDQIPDEEIKKRRDFRKILTFTIDPIDAKDFDDALSLRKLDSGNWEIGVHIADVTHYVQMDDELDKEAFKRGTSVYLVDRVVPMLPEKLSNFVCSLRPHEEKLCYSAVFEMDDNANVVGEWFGRTVINSDRRYNYEEAQEIIMTGNGDYAKEIAILDGHAKKLRAGRFKQGAIAFDRLEVKFDLDEMGKPTGVYFKENKDSNKLIEEFMLLANKKVAERIGKAIDKKNRPPFVYRVHDRPDEKKLSAFSKFIKRFGYKIRTTSDRETAKSINALLDEVSGKKEQNVIETLAIRSMAKAEYSTKNIGHYGLAFRHYTHFTSPIRRYPDMMVHRLLDRYLSGGSPVEAEKYEKMCKYASDMEQQAANAERSSVKYKQVEFLKDKIGQIYPGVISGVTEWGIYVEIIANKCEGMVPLRDMTDDFYIFDEDNFCIIGKHTKQQYRLGDEVKIEVVKANLAKKQLTFMLV